MPEQKTATLYALIRLNTRLVLLLLAVSWLVLLVSPSSGYISPLYPGAGIALAAILVFRWRVLPGVFLAALLAPVLALWLAGMAPPDGWATILSAIAVCLQAWVAAYFMRRLGIWPGSLADSQSVLLFICVVAPLCGLISAALVVPIMGWTVSVGEGGVAYDWGNWWVGNVLGMLLFTPVSLAFIGRPHHDWEGRKRSVALPLLICTGAMAGAMAFVHEHEDSRYRDDFERNAEQYANALLSRLDTQMNMLMSMERFIVVNHGFGLNDWAEVARPWLLRYPGTQNLSWDPLVRAEDRQAFELKMQQLGLPGYTIHDRDESGRLMPAAEAEEYLPIAFAEPFEGNARALGVNVLSLPEARETIERSRRTTLPAVSPAMRLVQTPDNSQSVVVYQVVPETDPQAKSSMRGVVAMAMQVERILAITAEEHGLYGVDICLFDESRPSAPSLIAGPQACMDQDWVRNHLSLARNFVFTDRPWRMMVRDQRVAEVAARTWLTWASLLVALGFSGMLSCFLLLITGRARRIEDEVAQRTAELAQATAQLREQKASLAQAQRMARMGSWEICVNSGKLQCSDEFRRLLDLPSSVDLCLEDVLRCLVPPDRQRLEEQITEAKRTQLRTTLDCCTPAGTRTQQVLHFQIESEWAHGRLMRIHGTVQNVTTVRQAEAHIQYLARFDALTGLPNRRHWQDMARAALNAARRHGDQAAVLFLDLDHFKNINDSLGHTVGDELLSEVANRLKSCLRGEDILARQGGDEFVLMLPRLQGFEDVSAVAVKLVKCLSEPVQVQGHELTVSVSIGISHFPGDGADIDTLLKHADVAMYSAKQSGRNNFQFFVPEMNLHAVERLQMESALRRAIEKGELILHFQPQLDLASGRIDACEALVRWMHPERGMVPPGDFIALAEETGLILPLGDWVLREACLQQAQWRREGLSLTMAINISALQFRQSDFTERVQRVIEETAADISQIELEITESALLGFTDGLVRNLETLQDAGVQLALDDFGTGYSCLSYLKRLPIKQLKIDRSFVKDLPGDLEDAAIASATLSMARDLGLKVVAEGVETEAQRAFLEVRGCRAIQGYLISRPVPEDQFRALVLSYNSAQAAPDRDDDPGRNSWSI